MTYNWQQSDWPHFRYSLAEIQDKLSILSKKTKKISDNLNFLSPDLQNEAIINFMVEEAVKTSEIEGEYISRPDIISSLRKQLGLNQQSEKINDMRARGIAELMLDVRNSFDYPLSENRLLIWHEMLLLNPTTWRHVVIGHWRNHPEPMQVVSGLHGKWTVHFEAPPSERVPEEMQQYIEWFNKTAPGAANEIPDPAVRAAIAHLYFESIHPFEDGNGRIGRALAEKALSQGVGYPVLLSLSKTIEANKKDYYAALKSASKSNEISSWINYFVNTILAAQMDAEEQVDFILHKAQFFDKYKNELNGRQLKVIKRILEEGTKGFIGGMSAKKYCAITKTSPASATRDLQDLFDKNIFKQLGAGRNIHYEINFKF